MEHSFLFKHYIIDQIRVVNRDTAKFMKRCSIDEQNASRYNILFLPPGDIFEQVASFYGISVEEYLGWFSVTMSEADLHWAYSTSEGEVNLSPDDRLNTLYKVREYPSRRTFGENAYALSQPYRGLLEIVESSESPLGIAVGVKVQARDKAIPITKKETWDVNGQPLHVYYIDGLLAVSPRVNYKQIIFGGFKFLVYPEVNRYFTITTFSSTLPEMVQVGRWNVYEDWRGWEMKQKDDSPDEEDIERNFELRKALGYMSILTAIISEEAQANDNRIPDIYFEFDSVLRL